MTIAIGMPTRDGMLIAADTELSDGYSKIQGSKIMTSQRQVGPVNCGLVVTGSGDAGYLEILSSEVAESYGHLDEGSALTPKALESFLGGIVRQFHRKHVYPMAPMRGDMPVVSLIIAAQMPDGKGLSGGTAGYNQGLWMTSRSAIGSYLPNYAVTGIGESEAVNLIQHIWHGRGSKPLKSLIPLVVYTILRVKETVQGCGSNTQIVCIRKGIPEVVNPLYINELETYFKMDGIQLEWSMASFLFGDDDEPLAKLSARIRRVRRKIESLETSMWLQQ